MMRAISLWRPWPWAIVHAPHDPKRLENRTYRPRCLLNQDVALHASQRWDAAAAGRLADIYPAFERARAAHPAGVVGVARVVGWLCDDGEVEGTLDPGLAGSHWRIGPVAWALADVRALAAPIPCSGRQGIWTLPADVEAAVEAALARDAAGGQGSGPDGRGTKKPGRIKAVGP